MMANKTILIIGKVWTEPDSSAAGSRMIQLIDFFAENRYEIHFASTANKSEYSVIPASISATHKIKMNDSSFDEFIAKLNPKMVLFDRFTTEEQFGWRVSEDCPDAIRILDMEDLHSLRHTRENAIKNGEEFSLADLANTMAYREIASIYRCDLSLVISKYELELLTGHFGIEESILHYTPFMLDEVSEGEIKNIRGFDDRRHFMTIGNFLHPPNYDAVIELKNNIWPHIRKELPDAKLYIYGAYTPDKIKALHDVQTGFLIKGRAEDSKAVISEARLMLAPLRFGAGLKGKLIEAMQCGTPSITTEIGAEGMAAENDWPGYVAENNTDFIKETIRLYTDKNRWKLASNKGFDIINRDFEKQSHYKTLEDKLNRLTTNLETHRNKNFIGQMLRHHTMASTKFMSRWIEEKGNK